MEQQKRMTSQITLKQHQHSGGLYGAWRKSKMQRTTNNKMRFENDQEQCLIGNLNQIHSYWLMKISSTHDSLAKFPDKVVIGGVQVPKWLLHGTATFSNERLAEVNQRPLSLGRCS